MLESVFISIVITSLTGTALSAALYLIKPVTRKIFGAAWHYYMWVCVLVVMMLPLRISIPGNTLKVPISEVTAFETAENFENANDDNVEKDAVPYQKVSSAKQNADENTAALSVVQRALPKASAVWIMGVLALLAYRLIKYSLFLHSIYKNSKPISIPEIRCFVNKNVPVRICRSISSPLLTGVVRPMLLIPDVCLAKEQLSCVISHEMTHCKRKDMLVKWFSLIVKSIHFFNPAVYFICKALDTECEISCDAAVIKDMTNEQKLIYVNTILSLLSESVSRRPLTTSMTGDPKTLKKRFVLMKNRKQIGKKAILASVLLAITLTLLAVSTGGIINGNVFKSTLSFQSTKDSVPPSKSYVGYIENATTDYIDVYTQKNGEYVMSIPWAVVEPFPANDRTSENYPFGWMEHFTIYCGKTDNFRWAVVCTKPVMSACNINVCTSLDGGKNWYVDNTNYMHKGIVENAWFVSETEGYISYSGGGYGKGVSRTADGGRTWEHKMEYDMPLPISEQDAVRLLKHQLITAYERRYGEYVPRYDDPGNMSGDKERLPFIIETLRITKDDGDYYTVPVIWDFLIEKETGKIYKFYDGIDKMLVLFDPFDENALAFAG